MEANEPILTKSRSAGMMGKHPIEGHQSFLPEPYILTEVWEALDLSPSLLLRHLNEHVHLTYVPRSFDVWGTTSPTELRIAVDPANHVTAVVVPGDQAWMGKSLSFYSTVRARTYIYNSNANNDMITVLILTAEDDCLGIDFNPATPATTQPLRLSMGTSRATFEAALRTTTEEQCRAILADPGRLVWLYTRAFVQAFVSHLELFRREWSILYEPYANKSSA
jgi:hypothetical protein